MAECPQCHRGSAPHCKNEHCNWRYCRSCDAIFDPAKNRWWSGKSN